MGEDIVTNTRHFQGEENDAGVNVVARGVAVRDTF
jgi:hypothetical protein